MKKQVFTTLLSVVIVMTTLLHGEIAHAQPVNESGIKYDENKQSADLPIKITGNMNPVLIDTYEDEINMSDAEALKLYQEYLIKTKSKSLKKGKSINVSSIDKIDSFVDYAVENKIIENNPVQRAALTKAIIRAEFKVVVIGGEKAGYRTASSLLSHSLQDYPRDLEFETNSYCASQIKGSSEFRQILNNFRNIVRFKNVNSYELYSKTSFTNNKDLYLALHNVDYIISGVRQGSSWRVTVTIKDTYNFEKQPWQNNMSSSDVVTAINNYAAYAQSMRAIVPYKIKIMIQTTINN